MDKRALPLIILGGADCVWDDADRALEFQPATTIAINDMVARWARPIDHAVSLHPDKLQRWVQERRRRGLPGEFTTWCHKDGWTDRHTRDWGGSSGLLAVKIARELGHTRIILCGIPMDAEAAHFFDAKPWKPATRYRAAWITRKQEISPFVRSMSGWTKGLLGQPDEAWLSQAQ